MHSLLHMTVLRMQPDILTRRLLVPPSSLVPLPLPSQRETHFWYALPDEVQNASLLNQYLELLSPCERESVLRRNGDKLQKGALLARALVRTTLARYTNYKVSPRSLKFKKNRFGKPEVEWQSDGSWVPPPLHFNVSHTSSLVACGVTADVPIGIDVEQKLRLLRNNVLSFARRYFSPGEVEFLHAFSDPEIQRREFLKLWTLKEAYVKALGRGFSGAPFKDFTIQFKASKDMQDFAESNSNAPKIVIQPYGDSEILTADWQFATFELASSHYVAVCVKKKDDSKDREESSLRLKVWKVLPLVSDENVSGTDAVVAIGGFHEELLT